MKKFYIIFFLFAFVMTSLGKVKAQGANINNNSSVKVFQGVPTGSCSSNQLAINAITGDFYDCRGGSWYLIGPSAAASVSFASVLSGTSTNQALVVSNGSTLNYSGSGIINANQVLNRVVSAFQGNSATFFMATGTFTANNLVKVDTNGNAVDSGSSVTSFVPVTRTINSKALSSNVTLLLASDFSDILTVAHGGTGTATPGLVAGTNVTITGTWPNQTINSTGGSGGAPTTSKYILQTPDGSLPNAQALSALATGILKNTTTTGVASIATSADVDALYTGSAPCYLKKGGTCDVPSGGGTVSVVSSGSLTSNKFVLGGGTTQVQTPSYSPSTDTSGNVSGSGTWTGTGFISNSAFAGLDALGGNTTDPTLPSNSVGWLAPSNAAFTSYFIRMPSTAPAANQVMLLAAPVSNVVTATYGQVPNAALQNASVTVNGTTCTLGSTCTPSGSGITLQTNGVNNGSQTTLNLAAGSGVTLTDGGTGTVTIAATGGGGGCSTCFDYTKHSEYNFVYRQAGSGVLALAYNTSGGTFSNSAWNVFSGTPTYGVRSSDTNFNFYIEMGPGSGGSMAGSMGDFAGPDWYRQANTMMHVRFEPVTGTNARYWVGFSSCSIATLASADNPVCNMVGLLASTTTGNHNWYLVTSNNTTTTLTDTGVAWAAGTAYELQLNLGASNVTGTVNGTATTTSTTIPATSSAMYGGYILVTGTSGIGVTQGRWDRLFLQSDN